MADGASECVADGASEGVAVGASEGVADGASEGVVVGASEGVVVGASDGVADGVTVGAGHAAPFPRSQQSVEPHGATRLLPDLAEQYWTPQRASGNVPEIVL